MISGWVSYAIVALIGLSLIGVFGDTRNYTLHGMVLILLFVWWILRRIKIIPTF